MLFVELWEGEFCFDLNAIIYGDTQRNKSMESLFKGFKVVGLVFNAPHSANVERFISHVCVFFLLVEKGVRDYALVVDRQRPKFLLLVTRKDSKSVIINDLGRVNIL